MPAYVEEMIYDDDGNDDAPPPISGQRGGAPPLPTRDKTLTLTPLPPPSATRTARPKKAKKAKVPGDGGGSALSPCGCEEGLAGPWRYGRTSTVAPPPKSWAVFADVRFGLPKLVILIAAVVGLIVLAVSDLCVGSFCSVGASVRLAPSRRLRWPKAYPRQQRGAGDRGDGDGTDSAAHRKALGLKQGSDVFKHAHC